VDPRVGLDDMEKWKFLILLGLELRPLCSQARSQSLYRLRYRGSTLIIIIIITTIAMKLHESIILKMIFKKRIESFRLNSSD
jgi:hypothetical protein